MCLSNVERMKEMLKIVELFEEVVGIALMAVNGALAVASVIVD